MNKENDPAKFWREQSIYHQERANFWMKISRVMAGVLTGILIVAFFTLR